VRRFPQLDGLRAVAALTIFATHAAMLQGVTGTNWIGVLTARLNSGVAIFFVLSGFLLYRPWVAARLRGAEAPDIGRYALHRAVRILPAYWAVLVILGVAQADLVPGVFGDHWWAYFGLLQVYDVDTILRGIGPAWSLATELAFYVALPFVALLTARLLERRGRAQQVRFELAGLAASAALAFLVRDIAARGHWMVTFDNTLIGRWPWFAAGLALAVVSVAREDRPAPVRAGWAGWVVAAGALVIAMAILPRNVFTMTAADQQWELLLFGVMAVGLMAPLLLGRADGVSPIALLRHPVAIWLGTISYGVFLWHYPIIRWTIAHTGGAPSVVVALLSLAITLVIATVSWYGLERPLLRRVRRERRPAPRAAPA
jgi:peptidoglycan/LPS O-acetylase OafA/YrhL